MGHMGRPSIFRDKVGGQRVQAIISKAGAKRFEKARKRLAKLAKWQPAQISDADVVEFLARGEADTLAYMKGAQSVESAPR